MTLDEIRTAMQCLLDTTAGAKPNCFSCAKKCLCDDFTWVIMKHRDTEKKKSNTDWKQEELIEKIKKYPAF